MAVAEYDRDADAVYIRLADGEVARTVEVDDYRILDLDEQGNVIGLEVLYPAVNLVIAPIARDHGFADKLHEIDQALADVFASPVEASLTMAITYVLPPGGHSAAGDVSIARSTATSAGVAAGIS